MVFCYYVSMGTLVGIDEVGRGSWAGPLLVVAAKANRTLPIGLADSKDLTKKQRENLYNSIIETCSLGEGWVQPDEIDRIGLAKAMFLGVSRALMELGTMLDEHIILDGIVNYCPPEFTHVKTIAKADSLSPIVSAASIYAKVTRDRHMNRVGQFYPEFSFEKHVGYGTQLHLEMLKKHGVTNLHRRSFKPIQALLA